MTQLLTVYCHGLPGSGKEIQALIPDQTQPPHILEPLDFDEFDKVISQDPDVSVHLIGFSLGAMTALHIAALRPDSVKKVTLIAPAAPLELENFLPKMVGRPVFKMAKLGIIPFKAFTAVQRLGVSVAATKVIKAMFDGSPEPDMKHLADPVFQAALVDGLQQSLGRDNKAYRQAVHTYVKPWAHLLADIKCPVTLHHGTLDNWAPIEMSHALQQAIPTKVELISYDGLGHYSTLHAAFPFV